MYILLSDGKQIDLNFIESGQTGVIIMFYMVLSMSGPFRFMLFLYDPNGVDMSSPSPLNCPILILSLLQLSFR